MVEVNEAFLRIVGLARGDVEGKLMSEVSPLDRATRAANWRGLFEGEAVEKQSVSFTRTDGAIVHALVSAERLEIKGERFALGVIADITALKVAEEALRLSEERFRQVAENLRDVFWLTDLAKERMEYISPAYAQIWGRPVETVLSSPSDWLAGVHPDDRERVRRASREQWRGGYDQVYRVVRPDGAVRWIRDKGFPVHDASGRLVRVAGVAQDITEERALEEQLRQTQKLESIGLLAGGIAHDFNNLLTVVQISSMQLLDAMAPGDQNREIVEDVREAGERAASLTRQLLAFSRKQVLDPKVLDLNAVVLDTEKMLRRLLGEDIILKVALDPQASPIRVDPGHLVQVLMNIAVNARDAMPDGGRLTIRTEGVMGGDVTRLTIEDTGIGMPPEVLSRIFEPFFTTKGVGRGTGLGLSVVHGIIEQSGGHVEVTSAPGAGTRFDISLPAADPKQHRSVDLPRPKDLRGSETILLVEDDELVRRAAVRVLEEHGYRVLQAAEGEEALRLCEEHRGEIELLVTDVVMPGMSGREVAERVLEACPAIALLYTSGYTDDVVVRRGVLREEKALLQKPYSTDLLLSEVRRLLAGRPALHPAKTAAAS